MSASITLVAVIASGPVAPTPILAFVAVGLVVAVATWGFGPLCRRALSAARLRKMRVFGLWVTPVLVLMGCVIVALGVVRPEPAAEEPWPTLAMVAVMGGGVWVGHFVGWWLERPRGPR